MAFVFTKSKTDALAICKFKKAKDKYVTYKFKNELENSDEKVDNKDLENDPDFDKFEALPFKPKNQRVALYISGVSGSGKSTYACNFIKKLLSMSKEPRDVNIFSVSGIFDKAFTSIIDNIIMFQVTNPQFLELTIHDLENSIVLMDDYNTTDEKNPGVKHALILQKEILEMGRKLGIDIIVINHKTRNYQRTASVIDESETFCLFPACNLQPVVSFVQEKIGVKNKKTLELIETCDEYCHQPLVIRKTVPRYMLSDKFIVKI